MYVLSNKKQTVNKYFKNLDKSTAYLQKGAKNAWKIRKGESVLRFLLENNHISWLFGEEDRRFFNDETGL